MTDFSKPGAPTISEALDRLVADGLGSEDFAERAQALARARDDPQKRTSYDAFNDWAHGAPERIVKAYEAGEFPTDEDAEALNVRVGIAIEHRKRRESGQ